MKGILVSLGVVVLVGVANAQSAVWGQCGGIGWTGAKTCVSGSTCVFVNDYYSQCQPSTATTTRAATTTTTRAAAATTTAAAAGNCQAVAPGFASLNGGTTGGNGGTVVTVSNQADLTRYAAASGKYVIKVRGRITLSPIGTEIPVASDKTIVGIGADAEISAGGFRLIRVKNIIIRNLKIGNSKVSGEAENDKDAIQIDTSSNIWIDHCLLENAGDGLLDSRLDTTFLTVSYNIFRNNDKTFGIGWTENVISEITINHNWFQGTNQRNPSADNILRAHLYNNYLNGVTSYGHYARGRTSMRMENVYFENTRNPVTRDSTATLQATGNIYQSCTGTIAANSGTVFNPASYYSYRLDPTADVPTIVKAQSGPKATICPA